MVTLDRPITVEEFEDFITRPENQDTRYELIAGEIVEVPSNPYSSGLASLIIIALGIYLREQGIAGHITGEGGGWEVGGERYAPDVAYLPKSRQTKLPYRTGYNPIPPEFAVEVISPSDKEHQLRRKIGNYLAAGTLLWVVYPAAQEVEVYAPGQPVQVIGRDGVLDGAPVLPGFALPVAELFPDEDSDDGE